MKRSAFDAMMSSRGSSSAKKEKVKAKTEELKTCPICSESLRIPNQMFNLHIDRCLAKQEKLERDKEKENHIALESCTKNKMKVVEGAVPGLYMIYNFLTHEEEASLLVALDNDTCGEKWKYSAFNGHCDSMSFGVKTVHGLGGGGAAGHVRVNDVSSNERDIPEYMKPIIERIHDLHHSFQHDDNIKSKDNGKVVEIMRSFRVNEFNANSYRKSEGHFLRKHVDDRVLSGPLLANISMLGHCSMRYNLENDRDKYCDVELPPRCLQIVYGKARFLYEHSIPADLLTCDRRVSLTFRQAGKKGQEVLGIQQNKSKPKITDFCPKTILNR